MTNATDYKYHRWIKDFCAELQHEVRAWATTELYEMKLTRMTWVTAPAILAVAYAGRPGSADQRKAITAVYATLERQLSERLDNPFRGVATPTCVFVAEGKVASLKEVLASARASASSYISIRTRVTVDRCQLKGNSASCVGNIASDCVVRDSAQRNHIVHTEATFDDQLVHTPRGWLIDRRVTEYLRVDVDGRRGKEFRFTGMPPNASQPSGPLPSGGVGVRREAIPRWASLLSMTKSLVGKSKSEVVEVMGMPDSAQGYYWNIPTAYTGTDGVLGRESVELMMDFDGNQLLDDVRLRFPKEIWPTAKDVWHFLRPPGSQPTAVRYSKEGIDEYFRSGHSPCEVVLVGEASRHLPIQLIGWAPQSPLSAKITFNTTTDRRETSYGPNPNFEWRPVSVFELHMGAHASSDSVRDQSLPVPVR